MPGPVRTLRLSVFTRTRQVGLLVGEAVRNCGDTAGFVTCAAVSRTISVICFGLPWTLPRNAITWIMCGPLLLGVHDRILSIDGAPFASGDAAVSTIRLSTRISIRVTPTLSTART